MNDKVTEIEIAKRLNENIHVSESIASDFISTYFSIIREALEIDGVVKISGLGTFKLIMTESRKIVSVQTKEDQEIPSHYRITFTPDKELAVRINEPYAHLSTVNLDEEGLKEEPVEPIANAAREYFGEEIKEIPLPINVPVLNKEVDSYVSDYTTDIPESICAEITNQVIVATPDTNNKITTHNRISLFIVLGATCMLTFVFFILFYFVIPYVSQEEELNAKTEKPEASVLKGSSAVDSVPVHKVDLVSPEKDTTLVVSKEEFVALANETIRYGSRLTLLARKYYGNKHFWCYIYEENKSHVANPNLISIGTNIIIPHPSKYGIDASSAASVEKAKSYSKELNSRVYPE